MTVAEVLESLVADYREGVLDAPKLIWRDQPLTDALVQQAAGHPYVRLEVSGESVTQRFYGTLDALGRVYDFFIYQEPGSDGYRPPLTEATLLFFKLDHDLAQVDEAEYGEGFLRFERVAATRPGEDYDRPNAIFGHLRYEMTTYRN